MPFTINYDKEMDCIFIKVNGQFDLSLLKMLASEVAKVVEKHGCRRIFNELRYATLGDILDTYHMPNTARETGIENRCKRALIVKEIPSEFDFLETVFVNRGHQVKMFIDVDIAKQWLLND